MYARGCVCACARLRPYISVCVCLGPYVCVGARVCLYVCVGVRVCLYISVGVRMPTPGSTWLCGCARGRGGCTCAWSHAFASLGTRPRGNDAQHAGRAGAPVGRGVCSAPAPRGHLRTGVCAAGGCRMRPEGSSPCSRAARIRCHFRRSVSSWLRKQHLTFIERKSMPDGYCSWKLPPGRASSLCQRPWHSGVTASSCLPG